MAVYTYSPDRVSVSLAGLLDIEGFASGTFVEIEKDAAPYSYQTAMDGEASRTFRKDNTYTVSVTLAQSSPSNNILSALHSVDLATQLGKIPLLIRDRSGTTNFFSPNVWIVTYPKVSFSNDIETRVWTFKCADGVLLVGGNGEQNLVLAALGLAGPVAGFLGG